MMTGSTLVKKVYITIGIADDYQPFSYKNQNGDYVGFDIEYISVLSKKIGVKIKLESIEWAQAEQKLKDKTVDALWNFSKTDARSKRVLFTEKYLSDSAAVVAKEASAVNIDKLEDVSKIAIQKVSTQEEWAQEKGLADKTVYCVNFVEAMSKLENGQVDIAVVDYAFARYYIGHLAQEPSPKLAVLDSNLYKITCNAAVRLTDTVLASKLNKAILAVNQDEAFNTLCIKWFGSTDGFR